jgi:hypothetical protein
MKKLTRRKLIKKLDTVFSLFIRLRHSQNEIVTCFTCGKQDHYKKMQCGHFMSRKSYSTRWDETNCQVQCVKCNMFEQGMSYVFGLRLNKIYGEGTAENLLYKSKKITKFTNDDIEEMIKKYQELN